jgi:hypothetical protein
LLLLTALPDFQIILDSFDFLVKFNASLGKAGRIRLKIEAFVLQVLV